MASKGAQTILIDTSLTTEVVWVMEHIYIRDLMTENPLCVDSHTTLNSVVKLMHEEVHSCIVIIDEEHPIGIITERDMVKVLSEMLITCPTRELYVTDFMASPPVCINIEATLYEALVITQGRHIRHLPVVDENDTLVGLLTQADIAEAHFHAIEKQRDIIEHQIKERTRELEDANSELKALTLTDGLLGIGNRRSMEVDLQFTHANSQRYKRPYSLVLLDVDCFKLYNDHYGHQAGDSALKAVADAVQKGIRSSDRLYRYGGEELLLLLPETTLEGAPVVVERVLQTLRDSHIPHTHSPYSILTLSAGISCADGIIPQGDGLKVVEEADRFLYQAKELGRDRVCWDEVAAARQQG